MLAGERREPGRGVGHHVADDVDLAADALAAQRLGGALVGGEEVGRERVDLDPVPLLRHRQVAASEPRLDVGDGDPVAGPAARQRRVGVAVDQDRVGLHVCDDPPQRSLDRRHVRGAEIERDVGLGEPELLVEHGRQRRVPVLARVHDDLVETRLAQRHRERRRLDELRPVPDDRQQPHRRRLVRGVAAARHALSVARRDLGPELGDDLDERPRRRGGRAVGVPRDRDQARRNPRHLEHGDVGALVHPEQRHDRVADPRADEALDDAALVGAKDDLELEPARAEERLHPLRGVAVADQRQPCDLPGPDRPLAPSELRAGGSEEDVGIGDDADALEGGVVVLDHEGEVELAALEQRVQLLVVAGLDQPHLDVRPTLDVAPHRARQQAHADALEGADAQRAGLAVGERPEIGLRGPHRRRSPARMPEQPLPGVGRRHGAAPPGRSSSWSPAARSRVAICWLIADWE